MELVRNTESKTQLESLCGKCSCSRMSFTQHLPIFCYSIDFLVSTHLTDPVEVLLRKEQKEQENVVFASLSTAPPVTAVLLLKLE